MASIDGKEKHDALDTRMGEKQPSTTQKSVKNSPSGQHQQFQREKAATSSKQGQGKAPAPNPYSQGYRLPKIQQDAMEKCISDGQNNDGLTEKGGSQIKILEMISDIFDSIPEFYQTINDIKSDVSDKT
ncbi:hypothetical protein O181_132953 [Austropuccinia psidii MF-1]|uniref:Uncharacterized protein n=1 Tax=Austropuccinia psidii MF-1 TaxID=1389203 RepID=A0A9Q3QC56_9BASI|nr:hypothetical protein [Austropuccinia psidii MF-1]